MKFISRAAGVAAATLVAGTLAAVAPATAKSAAINYDCSIPGLDGVSVPTSATLDTDAAASLVTGTASPVLNGEAVVTVSGSWADALRGMAQSVKGDADVSTTLDGAAHTNKLTIAPTTIPNTGDVVLVAKGPLYAVTAGAVGATHTVKAAGFDANLVLTKDGADQPFVLNCKVSPNDVWGNPLTTPQDTTVDTIAVTAAPATDPDPAPAKADTTTTTKAKFIKKKNMIKAVVKVAGGDTAATGKARVVVKKGKKVVKKLKVTVKNGKAVAKVKKITNKGKYKVNVTYLGDATHNKSKAKKVVVKVA